ncbi:MAG: transposase, partial [Deltaproteobacteria bacterium]
LCLALARSAARCDTSKHAPEATPVERAPQRQRLEHHCRDLLSPPLADRRLRLLPADHVALELKSPWKDGTKWISMSADTFLERLASLVPRPRTHQVLYRGALAA